MYMMLEVQPQSIPKVPPGLQPAPPALPKPPPQLLPVMVLLSMTHVCEPPPLMPWLVMTASLLPMPERTPAPVHMMSQRPAEVETAPVSVMAPACQRRRYVMYGLVPVYVPMAKLPPPGSETMATGVPVTVTSVLQVMAFAAPTLPFHTCVTLLLLVPSTRK